jgi:hypothetical protein
VRSSAQASRPRDGSSASIPARAGRRAAGRPERFAELAQRCLADTPDTHAVVTGAGGEAPLVERIVAALPPGRAHAVVGWPIARFVALQSMCTAFVCGDTGPLHTAVAAGAPTLGLMSRNRPAMFFPYPEAEGHRAYYARVECSPCHRDLCDDLRCLDRLTVEGAWRILRTMLAGAAASDDVRAGDRRAAVIGFVRAVRARARGARSAVAHGILRRRARCRRSSRSHRTSASRTGSSASCTAPCMRSAPQRTSST